MDLYLTEPVGPFPTAAGAAFGSFTVRQDVSPQPLPVIPAGKLRLGSKIRIEADGEYNTTVTPTLILGLYIGTRAGAITGPLAEQAVFTTPSGAANLAWSMEYRGIITAVGASTTGTIVGCGTLDYETSLTAITRVPIPTTLALRTVTLDTTIERAIGVCATFGTSNAANTVKTYNLSVSILN